MEIPIEDDLEVIQTDGITTKRNKTKPEGESTTS